MIGRKNRTTRTLLSLVGVSLMGVALVTASNAQTEEEQRPQPPTQCPDDSNVSILCRLKGTLVKKWVCETSRGRGVSGDLDEAVRRACKN